MNRFSITLYIFGLKANAERLINHQLALCFTMLEIIQLKTSEWIPRKKSHYDGHYRKYRNDRPYISVWNIHQHLKFC